MRTLLPLVLLTACSDPSGDRSAAPDQAAPGSDDAEAGAGAEDDDQPSPDDTAEGEGEGEASVDDGPDYSRPAGAAPSAPPDLVAPECPVGWSVSGAACDPGELVVCAGAAAAWPGDGGNCAPLARPDAPAGALEAGPDDDLAGIIAEAPDGAVVVVRGEHDVNLVLDRPITLMGAGEEAILWNGELEGDDGVEPTVKVMAPGGAVRLTGLTLTGGGPGVWVGHSAFGAQLEGVLIEETERYGFEDRHKGGQDTTLTEVVIRKIRPRAGRNMSMGLSAWAGARVVGRRLLIEEVTGPGIWINHFGTEPTVSLTLRDSVIREIHNDAPGGAREPIRVRNLANIVLERVVVERFDGPGFVTGVFDGRPLRTTVTFNDVAFRRATENDPEMPRVAIGQGTDLFATRLHLSELPGIAVAVGVGDDPDSPTPTAHLTGLDLAGPGGITLTQTADLTVSASRIHGVAGVAMRALGDGQRVMRLRLEDTEIIDGQALRLPGDGVIPGLATVETGGGVHASSAELELERVRIAGTVGVGVSLSAGATASVTDLLVDGVRGGRAEWEEDVEQTSLMGWSPGAGIVALRGTSLAGTRVSWRQVAGIGLMSVASDVSLEDATAVEAAGHPTGESGAGVFATEGATVRLDRVLVSREKWVGFMVHDDSTVILRNLTLTDTIPAPCGAIPEGEPGSCVAAGESHAAGIEAVVRNGAVLDIGRFDISGAALAGIVVAEGGELDLADGAVTGNSIGLNVLVDGFDYDRISERVFVFDNDTDLARVAMPIPDPAALLPFGGGGG